MQSNIFMYLTAMSAVSLHNLVNNIEDFTRSQDDVVLKTLDTNWTLEDNLGDLFANFCNGSRQSPINIVTKDVRENLNLRLGLTAYDKPMSGFLNNHFPTFQFSPFSFKWPRPSALVSSSLARSYNPYSDSHFVLQYIQLHWSPSDKKVAGASMHQIDGQDEHPVEIHFVHLNLAYQSLEEAISKQDGILILAVMVTPSTHESYVFDKLLDGLANITQPNSQIMIDEDSTWRSLLPADTSKFYRYQGSMVLPPCRESVQWIVFEDKLKLGHRQLRRLRRFKCVSRDLRTGSQIDWSSQRRAINPINKRLIERSFSRRVAV